ncbi:MULTISPECIES: SDR family oxidoreductase [unclassified Chelatococcus]|uniref:SDR family NAD(P)-dependent oxidoreductase n=1 Tax=unclassified Chelatococcus TaxID=2638111 RepID=UPI001BCD6DF3|nr:MULTISPECIES: SDR family oxidoreductase [unclassified Chelatococcus]MBS7700008.1 SDR family oxidoreductase [Chelatococcus sp. YT9]MBX3558567.1 SDR family oxidoreductase [Chelatococcus sp.]
MDQKRAFVTGAAGGIGEAIARRLARDGYAVAMADVNPDVAATAASVDSAVPVIVDVSDRVALQREIDSFAQGGLDVLVNNAVLFHYAKLTDTPAEIVDRMVDVGLKGSLWGTQAATPHLVARGGGCILNLSSMAVFIAIRETPIYTAIKGALDAFTRQQAVELGPFGIRVNALAPGTVPTPATNRRIDADGWELRHNRSPLRRVVSAEDIANAAAFLASEAGSGMTGVTLKVDAGATIAGPR